jgi:hypothetical protein
MLEGRNPNLQRTTLYPRQARKKVREFMRQLLAWALNATHWFWVFAAAMLLTAFAGTLLPAAAFTILAVIHDGNTPNPPALDSWISYLLGFGLFWSYGMVFTLPITLLIPFAFLIFRWLSWRMVLPMMIFGAISAVIWGAFLFSALEAPGFMLISPLLAISGLIGGAVAGSILQRAVLLSRRKQGQPSPT